MRIVILGAGYAGLGVALRLARTAPAGPVVLVNDTPEHQLTTQLHKVAAGSVPAPVVSLSLARLLGGTGVELHVGNVADIDPEARRVHTADGRRLDYDRLVVALGGWPETFGVPGVLEHAFHVQPLRQALKLRRRLGELRAAGGDGGRSRRIVVAGGGLTGVELAGELADTQAYGARRRDANPADLEIVVVEAGPRLLPGLADELGEESRAVLARKGVAVHTDTSVRAIGADRVAVAVGSPPGGTETWPADAVVWTAGVRSHPLTEKTFRSGPRGRALVDEYLRAVDYPEVYILGDNALAVSRGRSEPVAPTAQNAVQQGAVVAENLAAERRAAAAGVAPEATLTPYVAKPLGLFVSVGTGEAVGQLVFGDVWRPRLSGLAAYALKRAGETRYQLGIGAGLPPSSKRGGFR